ncbi:MAG: type II secretion system GspH family protein [Azoarcus sp.]|nr:type II secretion system GspH family protein [Azoarcus sp.]
MTAQRAFTLVELAVVLIVLSLLTGALIGPLATRIEAQRRQGTAAMLDNIEQAIIGFALLHGRLPCPSLEADPASPDYGLEHPPPCDFSAPGYLPWRSLGVPAFDTWGSARTNANASWIGHWRYYPDRAFTDAVITLDTRPKANIQIMDHAGWITTTESRAVAVLWSNGPNLHADGLNAIHSASKPEFQLGETTPDFDDTLRWLGHPLLIARLAQGGRL